MTPYYFRASLKDDSLKLTMPNHLCNKMHDENKVALIKCTIQACKSQYLN
jgi:hypothetical protein